MFLEILGVCVFACVLLTVTNWVLEKTIVEEEPDTPPNSPKHSPEIVLDIQTLRERKISVPVSVEVINPVSVSVTEPLKEEKDDDDNDEWVSFFSNEDNKET